MKNLYLSLLFLFFAQILCGQSFLRSYPVGFDSEINHIAALNDSTLVITIDFNPEDLGPYYSDSLRLINTDGTIRTIIETPMVDYLFGDSRNIITDLKTTTDGGFLIVGGEFECDIFLHGFIGKYDAVGTLEWNSYTFDYLPETTSGEIRRVDIKGDTLFAYTVNEIYTINSATGEALETTEIDLTFNSFSVVNEEEIYAHSNNLGWKVLTYPEGIITEAELPAFADFQVLEVINFDEKQYALSRYAGDFALFNEFEELVFYPDTIGLRGTSVFHTINGNFGIGRHFDTQSRIYLFDGTPEVVDLSVFNNPIDTRIKALTAIESQVFAGGHEKYVIENHPLGKQYVSCLFGQNIGLDLPAPILDLTVSELTVNQPVGYGYLGSNLNSDIGHRYFFEDIAITVTNNSDHPVNSFAVNTRYSLDNIIICGGDYKFQVNRNNLNLAAGESETIEIADLIVYEYYDTINFQLCFWVTHPDNQPDLINENDQRCIDFTRQIISSTENIVDKNTLKISPNPASDYLFFENIAALKNYNIFAADGRKIASGNLTNNRRIDISNLPAGIYFLRAEGEKRVFSGRFVKE